MTLDDAIAAFEKDFTVSDVVGYYNPDDSIGRGDMSRAPNGDRYVTLTSGGIKAEGDKMPALFVSADAAIEEWLMQAWTYAQQQGGKTLYWRHKPVWTEVEFVAVDQVALLNDKDWRETITTKMGCVISRLLVTAKETI